MSGNNAKNAERVKIPTVPKTENILWHIDLTSHVSARQKLVWSVQRPQIVTEVESSLTLSWPLCCE